MKNPAAAVVLVGTKHTYNIGLVSRAMSNYGLNELILVSPRCEVDVDAFHGAAGGNEPLKNLVRVSDWQQFLKIFPPGFRLGFYRRMDQEFILGDQPMADAIATMKQGVTRAHQSADDAKLYLVFGREDTGLSNEDLQMMNATMTFPTWGYPSMSLSHAVTTGAMLFRLASENVNLPEVQGPSEPSASKASEIELDVQAGVSQWLQTMGISLATPNNAATKFMALLRRAGASPDEWALLKKLILQTVRKL